MTRNLGRIAMMLLAVLLNATMAWAEDTSFSGGDGSAKSPYIITTAADWDQLSSDMASGNSYSSQFFELNADITVSTMVGSDGYKFCGHFDGNGKTLTLSYGTSTEPFDENYCAPFRYIDGADIQDLNVSGNIFTNKQFAAGIAGSANGDNTITNCLVSVDINSASWFTLDGRHLERKPTVKGIYINNGKKGIVK